METKTNNFEAQMCAASWRKVFNLFCAVVETALIGGLLAGLLWVGGVLLNEWAPTLIIMSIPLMTYVLAVMERIVRLAKGW